MQPIGTALPTVTLRPENPSPSVRSGSPAKRPAILDRTADFEIPRRVWSAWIPAASDGPRAIIQVLTDGERTALERRRDELANGLLAIEQGGRDRMIADSALCAMLGGFRSMRQRGEAVNAMAQVLLHLLRKFPCWAIAQACEQIATGTADIDPTWPPNDAQIHDLVAKIVAPFEVLHAQADRLLSARVEPPRPCTDIPDPTPAERERMMAILSQQKAPEHKSQPVEPGYMDRVLADIAARKASRSEPA